MSLNKRYLLTTIATVLAAQFAVSKEDKEAVGKRQIVPTEYGDHLRRDSDGTFYTNAHLGSEVRRVNEGDYIVCDEAGRFVKVVSEKEFEKSAKEVVEKKDEKKKGKKPFDAPVEDESDTQGSDTQESDTQGGDQA